jgi:hypothetical protein
MERVEGDSQNGECEDDDAPHPCQDQRLNEILVVIKPDAVVDPLAVVIHLKRASVALSAVMGP